MERSNNPSGDSESTIITINPPSIVGNQSTTTATINHSLRWPTIDGQLGLSEEQSVSYARGFYRYGFLLLPWLWAVNCFYFWPVLRRSASFPSLRPYVVRSAIGFTIVTFVMSTWALTFSIGGESLFGPVWNKLVMYNVADELGLTGWM